MSQDDMAPDKDDQMYVYKLFGISTPRRIKAINTLRQKIGPVATIREDHIIKAQNKIDKSGVNYEPYALALLEKVENIIHELSFNDYDREREYGRVVAPIAQLKGEAAMFGNEFVTEVSARILNFMEHYHRLDDDVLEILRAFCSCIRMAYQNNVSMSKSNGASRLIEELDSAVKRYNVKFRRRTET